MYDTAARLHNRPEGSGLTALALAAGQDPEVVARWLNGVNADFGNPTIEHARLVAYLTHQATPTVELEPVRGRGWSDRFVAVWIAVWLVIIAGLIVVTRQ